MSKTKATPNEQALQDEVDRLREDREHAYQRERQELQKKRQAQIKAYEFELRTATDWPEALRKQRDLFQREAREESPDDPIDEQYFTVGVQVVDKAIEIWRTINTERQDEIGELEQRLMEVQNEIRLEVAQRLEQSGTHSQYRNIADGIRINSPEEFLDW
jgi:hypothetical protein